MQNLKYLNTFQNYLIIKIIIDSYEHKFSDRHIFNQEFFYNAQM